MPLSLIETVARTRPMTQDPAVLETRAGWLADVDRQLVLAVLLRHEPIGLLANLAGVSRATMRRRVHRLVRRMSSTPFVQIGQALGVMDEAQRAVARLHLLGGRSLRSVVGELKLPYNQIRRLALEARGVARGLSLFKTRLAARPSFRGLDE